MDPAAGPPRLQRRNVEVFNSDGAVIAGTSLSIHHFCPWRFDTRVRILAVRHSPVGRVLQTHNRIHRDYDSLDHFSV